MAAKRFGVAEMRTANAASLAGLEAPRGGALGGAPRVRVDQAGQGQAQAPVGPVARATNLEELQQWLDAGAGAGARAGAQAGPGQDGA